MGYIFEPEIATIMNTVRACTIGESESIKLRDVLRADIHPAIKAYFKAEVEKILQDERVLEMRSKKLSYSLPEVSSLQRQIDIVLVNNHNFGQQDFDSLLDEAVHFQFNYLCRPQWTLLSFIFGTQRKVSTSIIDRKLRYCVDYTYFSDLIRRYASDRGLAEITYEEFKALLTRIDDEVVAQHSSLELARMTKALFSFIDAGKQVPHDQFDQPRLPVNAAIVFFEDKRLESLKNRLERERDADNVTEVTIADLATLIERVRTGNEEARIEASVQDLLPTLTGQDARNAELDRIIYRMEDVKPELKGASPEPVPPLQETQKESAQVQPPESPDNIYARISGADRKLFVKKLFRHDEKEFRHALNELRKFHSWQEASHYLDQLFVTNDVDPFSKEAVRFTDHVFARYKGSEK
ncbi:MAG: hypothetical protein HYY49_01090 [Ignavibacteriales bacterium]|nr:hypothetical protein [Ignavibacteriales bacterium]